MWPKLLAAPPEKDTWPLAGGNNVLRKRAWEAVKPHLIGRANLHEDIDIACAADKVGLKMWYCHTVYVLVSARRFKSPFDEIKPYIQTTLDTIEAHGLKDRAEWYKGQMPQVTKSFRLLWLIQHNYNPRPNALYRSSSCATRNHASPTRRLIRGSTTPPPCMHRMQMR